MLGQEESPTAGLLHLIAVGGDIAKRLYEERLDYYTCVKMLGGLEAERLAYVAACAALGQKPTEVASA